MKKVFKDNFILENGMKCYERSCTIPADLIISTPNGGVAFACVEHFKAYYLNKEKEKKDDSSS